MPELPKGFRYQGFDWSIGGDAKKVARNGNNAETDLDKLEIDLDGDRPDSHLAQTLLHELLHVADNAFPPDDQTPEPHIRILSQGLYAILTDNPDVRRFIWPENE